jgi:hypothetical protein
VQYSTCSTCYRLELEKLGVKIEGANNLNFLSRDVRFEWVQNWRAIAKTKTGIVLLLHVNLEQKPELWNTTQNHAGHHTKKKTVHKDKLETTSHRAHWGDI